MANAATLKRRGAISAVEYGIKVAWARPITMVVRTSPSNPPPIAQSAEFLPALWAITPNQIAVAAATGHGIKPTILLSSIILRLQLSPGRSPPSAHPYKNVLPRKASCHGPSA